MIEVSTPLRLPLGGGGTDLPHYCERRGGRLVAAAIRDAVHVRLSAAAEPAAPAETWDGGCGSNAARRPADDPWLAEALRHLGAPPDLRVEVRSEVPAGSGLGGSGAVLVALSHALRLWRGERPAPRVLAEEAFRVERLLMGRPVGRQDPYAAAYGGILELRIRPDGSTIARRLRLAPAVLRALERSLLLADTGTRRDAARLLAEQERAAGRAEAAQAMEGIHAIGRKVGRCLESGRAAMLGALFRRHWDLKRRLTTSTSTAAAEHCLDLGLATGARGGKLIGAGGGGFVLFDCGASRPRVERALAAGGFRTRRVALAARGSRLIAAARAAGAAA
jgi:D-glycero-alpha-D-manno-heptose-7-phosphate kinase